LNLVAWGAVGVLQLRQVWQPQLSGIDSYLIKKEELSCLIRNQTIYPVDLRALNVCL